MDVTTLHVLADFNPSKIPLPTMQIGKMFGAIMGVVTEIKIPMFLPGITS
jgi:hypothetical protein